MSGGAVPGDERILLGGGVEFDRIRAVARTLGSSATGLGDDCALIPTGSEWLAVSVDLSVEQVHFRRDWLTLSEIGWKATAGALSDLGAVGAEVIGVLAAVAVPPETPQADLEAVMAGVGAAVQAVGGKVLGGDLSAGSAWTIDIAVIGRTAHPVRRTGATAGDLVFVTGRLGGARAGLQQLRKHGKAEGVFRDRFAHPIPRISGGQWLANRGARAMIDLSDGLAGDAAHLAAASGVSVHLDLDLIPLETGLIAWAEEFGENAYLAAASGGEDYELLVVMPSDFGPDDAAVFQRDIAVQLTRIGEVARGEGVQLRRSGRSVTLSSFDHFG
ncbi:MAG: thiamine-phosphate kinase [Gemmatimonadota bacterium]